MSAQKNQLGEIEKEHVRMMKQMASQSKRKDYFGLLESLKESERLHQRTDKVLKAIARGA